MKKYQIFVSILILFAIIPFCIAQPPRENRTVSSQVIGTWKLVSIETIRPNGELIYEWMGRKPTGLITYDSTGNMSVQIVHDPRPTFAFNDSEKATTEEKSAGFDGYYAYFGTYELDEGRGVVIHHVQNSLRPEEVGIDYKRFFKLSGDQLILTTTPFQDAGEQRTNRLAWERVK